MVSSITSQTTGGLLSALSSAINTRIATEGVLGDWETRGAQVARYRRYYDGEHDAALTETMRKMLRMSDEAQEFNNNYIPVVIDTMVNRLIISDVSADSDKATAWLRELLDESNFDTLQRSLHLATALDGDSFIMIYHDGTRARLSHQLAYDGESGIIPVYESEDSPVMLCAVKIWSEVFRADQDGKIQIANRIRVNVYYPDRIEKFQSPLATGGTALQPYLDTAAGDVSHVHPWTKRDGSPLGIPILHFKNRPRKNFGISEIANALPLQDALNRTLHSLVSASEKTGFQVRAAFGFDPDPNEEGLAPGDFILAGPGGLDNSQQVRLETLEAGSLAELLSTARHLRTEIGNVTSTPAPELFDSDNLSGEAFAARESTLVGKLRSTQSSWGAVWEQVCDLAWEVEDAYSTTRPPTYTRARIRYADPASKSEAKIIASAVAVANTGRISTRAFLRLCAPVFGWDDLDIDRVLTEMNEESTARAQAQINALPDFRNFEALDAELTPQPQPGT